MTDDPDTVWLVETVCYVPYGCYTTTKVCTNKEIAQREAERVTHSRAQVREIEVTDDIG